MKTTTFAAQTKYAFLLYQKRIEMFRSGSIIYFLRFEPLSPLPIPEKHL
jgi:hypothetical protein